MSRVICHHKGRYNIYTTISDGFYWDQSISLEELEEFTRLEFGQTGIDSLPKRLERATRNGHSMLGCGCEYTLKELLSGPYGPCNTEHELGLSYEDCIERYLS